ncbi:MAG: hypothetical protein KAW12_28840, partial [Candidatus Aminicenantes bacterium]|nr:hypothetical protein [Candidatus Aminicenantes bacterium]
AAKAPQPPPGLTPPTAKPGAPQAGPPAAAKAPAPPPGLTPPGAKPAPPQAGPPAAFKAPAPPLGLTPPTAKPGAPQAFPSAGAEEPLSLSEPVKPLSLTREANLPVKTIPPAPISTPSPPKAAPPAAKKASLTAEKPPAAQPAPPKAGPPPTAPKPPSPTAEAPPAPIDEIPTIEGEEPLSLLEPLKPRAPQKRIFSPRAIPTPEEPPPPLAGAPPTPGDESAQQPKPVLEVIHAQDYFAPVELQPPPEAPEEETVPLTREPDESLEFPVEIDLPVEKIPSLPPDLPGEKISSSPPDTFPPVKEPEPAPESIAPLEPLNAASHPKEMPFSPKKIPVKPTIELREPVIKPESPIKRYIPWIVIGGVIILIAIVIFKSGGSSETEDFPVRQPVVTRQGPAQQPAVIKIEARELETFDDPQGYYSLSMPAGYRKAEETSWELSKISFSYPDKTTISIEARPLKEEEWDAEKVMGQKVADIKNGQAGTLSLYQVANQKIVHFADARGYKLMLEKTGISGYYYFLVNSSKISVGVTVICEGSERQNRLDYLTENIENSLEIY